MADDKTENQSTENTDVKVTAPDNKKVAYGYIIGVRGPVVDVRFHHVLDIPALFDVVETKNFVGGCDSSG